MLLRFAHTNFFRKKPKRIGLAVSGGSDSMAMLHLMAICAQDDGTELFVATVDHGLRPEAADEAVFVGEICAGLGVSHTTLKWVGWDGKGNVQAKAREARYGLLADWAKESRCELVCLGHTEDDVAETFLMRLGRSAGLDGLAAMESDFELHDVKFKRPLISRQREELRGFLSRHNFQWHDDPSNEDIHYDRVRARKILETLGMLGIDRRSLSQSAHLLQDAKHSLRRATQDHAKQVLKFDRGDVIISRDAFAMTDLELRRRILLTLFQWISGSEYPPRNSKLFNLDLKVWSCKPYMVHGCAVTYGREGMRISRELNAVKDARAPTDTIWDGRWQMEGPHHVDLEVRALGPKGLPLCPEWRDAELPRLSLLSSPSVWRGDELIAAPLAKLNPKWHATLVRDEKQLFSSLFAH